MLMKRISTSLALMALAVAFASCDDPITRKERSLIDRQYKEGVLTASQSYNRQNEASGMKGTKRTNRKRLRRNEAYA